LVLGTAPRWRDRAAPATCCAMLRALSPKQSINHSITQSGFGFCGLQGPRPVSPSSSPGPGTTRHLDLDLDPYPIALPAPAGHDDDDDDDDFKNDDNSAAASNSLCAGPRLRCLACCFLDPSSQRPPRAMQEHIPRPTPNHCGHGAGCPTRLYARSGDCRTA